MRSRAVTVVLVLATTLAALPAAAACPTTSQDSVRGIIVTLDDGTRVTMRRDAATRIVAETWDDPADQTAFREELLHGLHLLASHDLDEAGHPAFATGTRYRFLDGPLPDPADGVAWSGRVEVTQPEGIHDAIYSFTVGALREISIGGCTLAALPVTSILREPDYSWASRIDFVPVLGIGLLRENGELMGEKTSHVPVSIAVAGEG